jgi:hypothetical protein
MTSTIADSSGSARMQQNWVIDRLSDWLLIIGTPLISLVLVVATASRFGAEILLVIFGALNVGHHLPTFIRIYGDKDLLRRFRWSLLLGPVLPFSLAMSVVLYVVLNGYDMSNILYLMLFLILWDPWHFLRQHFGFMRIYDRNNQVRRKVSWRMDFMITCVWFVYIMVAALDWLPDLLYDSYRLHGSPILFLFDNGVYDIVQLLGCIAAVAGTVVYLGYLAWCRANGYFVSPAKVMLLIFTYGVMYLTYVPNPLMTGLYPGWNFILGFAVIGVVHVTQYLAIVWKYNRGLSGREGAARSGIFQKFFSRGGWNLASIYVIVCVMYGAFLAFSPPKVFSLQSVSDSVYMAKRLFLGTIFALGFTSGLMHYYFDGFIWMIRHKENQEFLGMRPIEKKAPADSWWEDISRSTARAVFFRHCLYFALPILLLSASFWMRKGDPIRSESIGHAITASSVTAAEAAILAMEDQLEIESAMISIRPRSKHYTYQADLLYTNSLARVWVADQLGTTSDLLREERSRSLAEAIASLERALEIGPPYGHAEDPEMSRTNVEGRLLEWRLELQQI